MSRRAVLLLCLWGFGCGSEGFGTKGGSHPGDPDTGEDSRCMEEDEGPLLDLDPSEIRPGLLEALDAADAFVGDYAFTCTPLDWTTAASVGVHLGAIDRASLHQYVMVGGSCDENDRWFLAGDVDGSVEPSFAGIWSESAVTIGPVDELKLLYLSSRPADSSTSRALIWWSAQGDGEGSINWDEGQVMCDFTFTGASPG